MKKWQRMKRVDIFLLVLIIWIFYDSEIFAEATLQQQIDQTPAGGTLVVKSGTFCEPITIDKSITFRGSVDTILT